MTNFLSLKEIFLISLQGKPILGVILLKTQRYLSVLLSTCSERNLGTVTLDPEPLTYRSVRKY